MKRFLLLTGVCAFALVLIRWSALPPTAGAALPFETELSLKRDQCSERVYTLLLDEAEIYRNAQMDSLSTVAGNTTDIVPYLVQNYHALSCRMRTICKAVGESHGHLGVEFFAHRPLGCTRLLGARGRWWDNDRRNVTQFTEPITECAYVEYDNMTFDTTPSFYYIESLCDGWVEEILHEERQMLRLLVARDAGERGVRRVAPVFQNVLTDVRESFLIPLRGMVDLFGSVIHPIPCILRQCN